MHYYKFDKKYGCSSNSKYLSRILKVVRINVYSFDKGKQKNNKCHSYIPDGISIKTHFGRREPKGWINIQGDLFRKFINLLLPALWIHSCLINKIEKIFFPRVSFPSRNIFNYKDKDIPSYLDILTFIFIQNE